MSSPFIGYVISAVGDKETIINMIIIILKDFC